MFSFCVYAGILLTGSSVTAHAWEPQGGGGGQERHVDGRIVLASVTRTLAK